MRRSTVFWVWLLMAAVATVGLGQSFRGELTARYRDRSGSEDWEDQDLFTYLWLDFWADDEQQLGGAFSLRWDADLLTRANEIDDGDDELRLYYAYLDVDKVDNLKLRIGQQIVDEAEGFQLVGAKVLFEVPQQGLQFGLFGGLPVSYWDSTSGEWAAGGSFGLRAGRRSRLRGSWVHVEEELAEDDVVTVSYRYASEQGWHTFGTVRTLNFDVWNESLGGSYLIAPWQLHLTGSYRRQENTNDSTSRYYSAFAASLGPSLPYHRLTLSLNRPFGEWVAVGAGWSRRELLDDAENRGNQEYSRYFFDLYLLERLLGGFEATVDVSRWETDRDQNTTLSGSLSRRLGERWRFDLGTYYAKYEVRRPFGDPDAVPVERFDSRSWYLRGEWRVRGRYRLRLDLERGDDDTADDAFYQAELLFGLDLGYVFGGFKE